MKIILTESQFKRVILKEESNDQDMMVRKLVNSQLIRGIVDITGEVVIIHTMNCSST